MIVNVNAIQIILHLDTLEMLYSSNILLLWSEILGIIATIRTTRNTRSIWVVSQKVFYIRAPTIPTRIGNPMYHWAILTYYLSKYLKLDVIEKPLCFKFFIASESGKITVIFPKYQLTKEKSWVFTFFAISFR